MSKQPTIYEINAPIFLRELSEKEGRTVTFADVPDYVWDDIANMPFDIVWFMGVWKRSTLARDMALHEQWLRDSLADLRPEDVAGSAYSIQDYHVEDSLGGNDGLAVAREQLHKRGIKLMLDYVPNHVGIDHPWLAVHPEYFLPATGEELVKDIVSFIQTPQGIFARGRDPNYEAWSDVLQLNAFSPGLRHEVTETLVRIAGMCDGLRCDMAMLMMNDIFKHTWGKRAGKEPADEYWPSIIAAVKRDHPEFIFLAEVYWDKELLLIEQGFDFCYDKDTYDYLINGSVHKLQKHLDKTHDYQDKLLRFIENHDEERAAKLLFQHHAVAALILATLPGAHLYHEGQLEGRQHKIPVHLSRRIIEEKRQEVIDLYAHIFSFIRESQLYAGEWQKLDVHQGLFGRHAHAMLAWSWKTPVGEYVFCINFTDDRINGSVPYLKGKQVSGLTDQMGTVLDTNTYLRGAHMKLAPWQAIIVELDK